MSSHRDSIAASFSWRLMSLSGRLNDMGPVYLSTEQIQIPLANRCAQPPSLLRRLERLVTDVPDRAVRDSSHFLNET
jgi:hypothetical protein